MPPSGSTVTTTRQPLGMPKGPDRDSIVDTWDYLADGITKIMTDLENGMTMDDVSGDLDRLWPLPPLGRTRLMLIVSEI